MRDLWIFRAGFFLAYWRYLKVDELLAMRSHFRTIWATDPTTRVSLLQAAERRGQIAMISWALGDDPEAQAEFERLRALLPKPAP